MTLPYKKKLAGRDARTPGGPFGWQRLWSRWLVSLAGLELQGGRDAA
ncbi:MAG: hypothetical protein WAW52_03245 [Methanothrix sp.]